MHGMPRFIITDHGPQFRKRFGAALERMGIHHVRSQVGQPFLNGKVERLFRSLRIWWHFKLPCLTVRGMQRKLDAFAAWYNEHRVHAALGPMTPSEADNHSHAIEPIPIRCRDTTPVDIRVARHACRGDPRLPIIDICVQRHAA